MAHQGPFPRGNPDDTVEDCVAGAGLFVLLVGGAPALAGALAAWLRWDGHRAEAAPDVAAALRLAQARPPDVVLAEAAWLCGEGREMARRLVAQMPPAAKRPFVIAVRAAGAGAVRLPMPEAGIDLCVEGTVDLAFLRRLLRRLRDIILPGEAPP